MSKHTKVNLKRDVEDYAPKFGLSPDLEFRAARDSLACEQSGFSYQRIAPGFRQPFGHRHKDAEEVYYVISGSGAIKLDDGVHQLHARDIVRLAPHVTRALEGGPDGMELIAFGARHAGAGEIIDGYWEH